MTRLSPNPAALISWVLVLFLILLAGGCRETAPCYPLEDNFCTRLAEVTCQVRYLCLDESAPEMQTACETQVLDRCEQSLRPALVVMSRDQTLRFQGRAAAACLDGLAALTCDEPAQLKRDLERLEASCRGIALGLQVEGASCSVDAECEAGCHCAFGRPEDRGAGLDLVAGTIDGPGRCATSASRGQACDCDGRRCSSGLRCHDRVCVRAQVTVEGDCVDTLQCARGSVCREGICRVAPALGQGCEAAAECLLATYCGTAVAAADGTPPPDGVAYQCKARLPPGASCGVDAGIENPCTDGSLCACPAGVSCSVSDRQCVAWDHLVGAICDVPGAFCEAQGRLLCRRPGPTCVAAPSPGEACGVDEDASVCLAGFCLDRTANTCIPLRVFGEACLDDAECGFGACREGICRPGVGCDGLPFWVLPFGGTLLGSASAGG